MSCRNPASHADLRFGASRRAPRKPLTIRNNPIDRMDQVVKHTRRSAIFVAPRTPCLSPALPPHTRVRPLARHLSSNMSQVTAFPMDHLHRSGHSITVEGTEKVTIDNKVPLVSENESVYTPLGAVHRKKYPGKLPRVLI